MENTVNEVILENVEEVTDAVADKVSDDGKANVVLAVGALMTAGAIAWELAVKPVGKIVIGAAKNGIEKVKHKIASRTHGESDEDVFHVEELEGIE